MLPSEAECQKRRSAGTRTRRIDQEREVQVTEAFLAHAERNLHGVAEI